MLSWTSTWYALLGGALIGGGAALLWLLQGRVAGISGIVGGLFTAPNERPFRLSFLLGLLVGGVVMMGLQPSAFAGSPASLEVVLLAGVLVGVGTTLANGCTSGHGVCGVSRGSKRSLLATATFMGTGMLTVYLVRHWLAGATS